MTLAAEAPVSIVRFTVNGLPVESHGPGGRRLLDVLRRDLSLTGTKEGCGEGECGTCSVLLDGQLVDSCLVPVAQVEGRSVQTIEGLASGSPAGDGQGAGFDPLQAAFLEAGASQCGFCTPAMLLAGRSFLDGQTAGGQRTGPTEAAVREAIAGTLCRCTGYTKIVAAIQAAAGLVPARMIATDSDAPPRRVEAATPGGPLVVSPGSLVEALRLLAGAPYRPIAGGTDLMVAIAAGAVPAAPLLDLSGLAELRGIRLERDASRGDDLLAVGALMTFAELRASPIVRERLPALAEAAASVGAVQIQQRGTIGGNAINASPAGDSLPVLLAADAQLVLASMRGERTVPAASFFTAYRRTALAPDELLVRILFPLLPGGRMRFHKVGTRRAQAISKVVLALAWREEAGTWRDVRLALGSVAPTPIRAPRTEAVLEGTRPSADLADLAADTVIEEISPIDDVRSTASYRRLVTGRVLRRLLLDAAG